MFRPLVFVLLLTAISTSAFAQGGCTVFLNANEFTVFNESHGKFLKGVEDFEESNIGQGQVTAIPNPLRGNVPNVDPAGIGFPTGLEQKNIVIQDNVNGCNAAQPAPGATGQDIAVAGAGFFGANSKKITSNYFASSTDLLFPDPNENHTGIGFELGIPGPFGISWNIMVFDKANNLMLQFTLPPTPEPNKAFFGVWCERSIGRINICNADQAQGTELIDDIQMWEEVTTAVEPATWGSIKNNYR
jgi:hypothetical protein